MIAFKKDLLIKRKIKNNYNITCKKILRDYKIFKKKYRILNKKLRKEKKLIGYGGGQMVPSVAYHLNKNLDYIDFFVDDNPNRVNYKYPFIKAKIKLFSKNLINKQKNKNIVITALDGAASISKKLKKLKMEYFNPTI